MDQRICRCLFFYFLLLLALFVYCSGNLVRLSNDGRNSGVASLIVNTAPALKLNKGFLFQMQALVSNYSVLGTTGNPGVSVDIYLKQDQFGDMRSYKASLVSWLKINLRSFIQRLHVRGVIVSCSTCDFSRGDELKTLLPVLRFAHTLIESLKLDMPVKVSVSFPLPLLKSLNTKKKRDLNQIFHFLRKTESFVVVEDCTDAEFGMADEFVQSLITHAHVPIVLSYRSFGDKILRYEIPGTTSVMLLEISKVHRLQLLRSSRRELLASFVHQATKHDSLDPPTPSFPTTSVTNPTTMPSNLPPFSPTPTIITIPATNPITDTPTNPIPLTTPIPVTPTNPIPNPAAPFVYPGAQPVTNPVTTYPSPMGGVSVTSPVTTTPVTAPATTNAPQIAGQTWCTTKSGVEESALQGALDYACGIADCSLIQQGASCFDPNTLENHASFAFNSYFLKNPVASSCDFGGTAALVNTDPSSGSCVYPSAAVTSAPSTIPPATTSSSSGVTPLGTEPSYSTPPSIFNPNSNPIYNPSSNPTSGSSTGYGSEFPPLIVAPPSQSTSVQSYFNIITLISSLAMGLLLDL